MKILVFSHEFPPIGGGGGRVVKDIAGNLAARKHDIHVLTAHWGNLPRIEEKGNLTIERIPSARRQPYRAGFLAMGVFVWKSFWRGLRLIHSWQPDLIHAHFAVPAGAAAAVLSLFTGIPYVITAHGGDVPGGAPEKTSRWFKFILPLSKIIWKNAAAVTAVSPETRKLAEAHYAVPIQVIPNGIDLSEYKPGEKRSNKITQVIYIGRFSPEKNAHAVPIVMAGLKDLSWHCIMLGDGPDMELVRKSIAENSLENHFTLPGWVSPDEVKSYLALSDILFLPSKREGMPMAGLQGLASGLALVLSRIGSCPDLVKPGVNGFLVKPDDIAGYQRGLRKIICDSSLLAAFRKKSREIASRFDLKNTVDAYESLFLELIENRAIKK